ncbi:MAG TPA: chemotaxis protein CheB [Terracidiphilus sp.]
MGDDGACGMLEMKQDGAATIAEDESTCFFPHAERGNPAQRIGQGCASLQYSGHHSQLGAVKRRRCRAHSGHHRSRCWASRVVLSHRRPDQI